MVQLLWKAVGQFLKKLIIKLSYDLVTPLRGVHLQRIEGGDWNGCLCTGAHAALSTAAERWEQLRCPPVCAQTGRMRCRHTLECIQTQEKEGNSDLRYNVDEPEDIMLVE